MLAGRRLQKKEKKKHNMAKFIIYQFLVIVNVYR